MHKAAFVIEKLDQSLADHIDNWTVNPAAAVALNLAVHRRFEAEVKRFRDTHDLRNLHASSVTFS